MFEEAEVEERLCLDQEPPHVDGVDQQHLLGCPDGRLPVSEEKMAPGLGQGGCQRVPVHLQGGVDADQRLLVLVLLQVVLGIFHIQDVVGLSGNIVRLTEALPTN